MEKCEEMKIGNITIKTVEQTKSNKYGITTVIENKNGEKFDLPLENMESENLRNLADLMDNKIFEYQQKYRQRDIEDKKQEVIDLYKNSDEKLRIITVYHKCGTGEIREFNFKFQKHREYFLSLDYMELDSLEELIENKYSEIRSLGTLHIAYIFKDRNKT